MNIYDISSTHNPRLECNSSASRPCTDAKVPFFSYLLLASLISILFGAVGCGSKAPPQPSTPVILLGKINPSVLIGNDPNAFKVEVSVNDETVVAQTDSNGTFQIELPPNSSFNIFSKVEGPLGDVLSIPRFVTSNQVAESSNFRLFDVDPITSATTKRSRLLDEATGPNGNNVEYVFRFGAQPINYSSLEVAVGKGDFPESLNGVAFSEAALDQSLIAAYYNAAIDSGLDIRGGGFIENITDDFDERVDLDIFNGLVIIEPTATHARYSYGYLFKESNVDVIGDGTPSRSGTNVRSARWEITNVGFDVLFDPPTAPENNTLYDLAHRNTYLSGGIDRGIYIQDIERGRYKESTGSFDVVPPRRRFVALSSPATRVELNDLIASGNPINICAPNQTLEDQGQNQIPLHNEILSFKDGSIVLDHDGSARGTYEISASGLQVEYIGDYTVIYYGSVEIDSDSYIVNALVSHSDGYTIIQKCIVVPDENTPWRLPPRSITLHNGGIGTEAGFGVVLEDKIEIHTDLTAEDIRIVSTNDGVEVRDSSTQPSRSLFWRSNDNMLLVRRGRAGCDPFVDGCDLVSRRDYRLLRHVGSGAFVEIFRVIDENQPPPYPNIQRAIQYVSITYD